ncbi:sialate O-acetylesterase [Rubellicoccus peritrichatus]|uniref:Sialate O-acetylesterase n=1 Tax=Rubellicoccus peritrichatus TaxID=3080537 RepID=A0AAQ3L7Z2_9BACT|nr:sialate O-acetylesterase [Puniceicoccus sp. CR14]WOO41324.1 sialate O-acetylesterase [Puniceicoccus sp. CR14]
MSSTLLFATALRATISLPAIFGDNMVLQAEQSLPFWGKALPGERITVAIRSDEGDLLSKMDTVTSSTGRWETTLPEVEAGIDCRVSVSGDKSEAITFRNVLTGQVWVCSGQSNMAFGLNEVGNADEALANADNDQLRLFLIKCKSSEVPLDDVRGEWMVCSPSSVDGFSAVAYFFGENLNAYLNQPIGLIATSWGATPAEAWTPMEAIESEPVLSRIIETYQQYQADPSAMKDERGRPYYRKSMQKAPSWLYNGMIHPIVPYAIKGAIWYQGESNDKQPKEYQTLFPLMIESWREKWNQGDFPFIYVELAGYGRKQTQPSEGGWAPIREAQGYALELPNTSVGTAVDVGEEREIHPRDKETVGKRLALAAEGLVYGREGLTESPRFERFRIENNQVHLEFINAEGGLSLTEDNGLTGFAITDDGDNWVWADAVVDGETIIVSSDAVEEPVAVRYGWAKFPIITVYSQAELPLLPFQTDKS